MTASGDPEVFGHGNLHAFHVVSVPNRLQERICEAEVEEVLHCFLAQIMVDAIHGRFGEKGVYGSVERLRGSEVVTKRLLNHYSRVHGAARPRQTLCHDSEHAGWNRQIM